MFLFYIVIVSQQDFTFLMRRIFGKARAGTPGLKPRPNEPGNDSRWGKTVSSLTSLFQMIKLCDYFFGNYKVLKCIVETDLEEEGVSALR